MCKLSKEEIVKEIQNLLKYFKIFYFQHGIFQNQLITRHTCVEFTLCYKL